MVDILDVPKIYSKFKQDWKIWVDPFERDGWWYSKDYYKEVIDGFDNASGSIKIIFITIPTFPK